jgi:GAF domain-containing protein
MATRFKPIFHALAPILRNERARQAEVDRYAAATRQQSAVQAIVEEAAALFGAQIGIATIINRQTMQVFARHGTDLRQTERDISFCGHAIARPDELMCVFDAAHDPRFAGNPLVTGDPRIRFYVGAPLVTPDGHALGALCAIDTRPRLKLETEKSRQLKALAERVTAALVARV